MSKIERPVSYALATSIFASTLCAGALLAPTLAGADIYKSDNLKVYGDFRTRFESDFDSVKSDGVTERDDRSRLRVRARLGFNYTPGEHWDFGMRLRSGSDDSQQSPHITIVDFDDNETGDSDFNLDKWFLKGKTGGLSGWVGRNSLPYWKQNEFFWDDDVTPAGVGGNYKMGVGENSKLEFNAGYFSLPAGMKAFSGNLGEGQVAFHSKADNFGWDLAVGLLNIDADSDNSNNDIYQSNNGSRDYKIWTTSAQVRFKVAGQTMKIGADYMHNAEDYSPTDPDPFTAANHDQIDGYDIFVKWGSKKAKQWLLAYYYANIETFAVNNSFAQDDWVRWGSATQTRASDMKGSEFRVAYGLTNKQNLVARLYVAEAITTDEDGNRFRLDWNVKF